MCRVLEVSRSGYYAWLKREPSARDNANAALLKVIKDIHEESDKTYGAPGIHAELEERGPQASLNRVVQCACAGLTPSLVALARVAKVFCASSDLHRHRIE